MPNEPLTTETLEQSEFSLRDLQSQYQQVKTQSSTAADSLNSKTALKSLDSINEIIAEAMEEIENFTTNQTKPGFIASATSKAVATIDPNHKWAGKWLRSSKENIAKDTTQNQTLQQISDRVIDSINKQREDVMRYMESINDVRSTLAESSKYYKELLKKAEALLPTVPENTREQLDTKGLITRCTKSIMQLESTIKSEIGPLLSAASIAIQEIDAQLPDLEYDLKHKSGLKIAQQSLSDLIGMAKSVKDMTETAGDAIRKDIRQTTIESIEMVGDVMLDTDRMKKIQQEEAQHMKKVRQVMDQTQAKINSNFSNIQQLQLDYNETKEESAHVLLENTKQYY